MAEIPSVQVVVPDSSNITLSQPGKYTIFYEYRSVVGNRIYSTGEGIIFVKNAQVGDKNIKIKINSVVSNFATAEIATGSTDTT
jgi:hypothetical protein